jgi:predicted nucleic-acid-binding Zn-ribbon protein
MRTQSRCPKCSGTKLYVCENQQPESDSSNGISAFRVIAVPISQDDTGAKDGSSYRTHVGSYETWICAACGYTEWYAKDDEHLLEKLSKIRNSGVRFVDGSAKAPYR